MDKKSFVLVVAMSILSTGLCIRGYADSVNTESGYVTAIVPAEAAASETMVSTAESETTVDAANITKSSTDNATMETGIDVTTSETTVSSEDTASTETTVYSDTTASAGSAFPVVPQTEMQTASTGTGEFGPMAGTDTSGTAASTGTASSEAAYVYADGTGETLPLPSGYHFGNIATYTYQNMVDDLTVLKAQYPAMQMDILGTTSDNRSLYHVVIGNPNAKHKVLVHAGIHAREYIVSQLAMREIASLLEMQQKGAVYRGFSIPEMLQNTCFHFIPMVDPDGITLVQGGIDALQTDAAKTSVMTIAGMDGASDMGAYLRTWKNNINGVNLNRNFDANWDRTPSKVDHPSSMNYKGTAVECEVESRAIADLTRSIMPDRTISYHTQGKVIYWYFGETGTYKNEGFNLASIVHNNTGYSISNSWSESDAAGYKDWAVQKLDIPSVTIECGIGTSPVPEEQIESMWARNDGILPDILVDLLYK